MTAIHEGGTERRLVGRGWGWWGRVVVLVACAWIFHRHLSDPLYGGIAKGINLAIHEAGHALFGWFDDFVGIAGGTMLQLAAPMIAMWMFYRQKDRFGIAIALCWLATNFFDVAAYAADARAGQLPLVSIGGGDPEHDWFIMLAETGLLNYDVIIGRVIRGLGVAAFIGGLVFGVKNLKSIREGDT